MTHVISIRELPDHRDHLLASIRRITMKYNTMNAETKRRADRTVANLHAQLNQIDDLLCSSIPQ